jgi:hypothetical protein
LQRFVYQFVWSWFAFFHAIQYPVGILQVHLTALNGLINGRSTSFSGGGAGKVTDGGVHPALRHVACTSAPRWYLKLPEVTRTLGMVILVPSGGCHLLIASP